MNIRGEIKKMYALKILERDADFTFFALFYITQVYTFFSKILEQ